MSLVPYVTQELANPANQALIAATMEGAYELGKKGVQAYKGRQKKRKQAPGPMETLGRSPGHNESRRTDRQSVVTSISNKELEQVHLIQIEKDVAADENISKRSRDTVMHKGVKVCFTCKNITTKAVFLNWGLVIPKAQNNVSNVNILRSNGQDRDVTLNNALSFMDLRCLPINTDMYRVLDHRRILIKPDSDKGVGNADGGDLRVIEKYVKTNRQIFFDGSTATPLQNIFMVWWVDYYGSPTGSTSLTADVSWRLVNYFQDIP